MSEKELLAYLQGRWEAGDNLPNFEIVKKNVIVNGNIAGIGIPGLDNTTSKLLILKWNADFNRWQLFIEELGWLQTFIDEIGDGYFTVKDYDPSQSALGAATRVNKAG